MRLEFRVRVKSALDLKILSKIGDPAGYDLAHNLHIQAEPLQSSQNKQGGARGDPRKIQGKTTPRNPRLHRGAERVRRNLQPRRLRPKNTNHKHGIHRGSQEEEANSRVQGGVQVQTLKPPRSNRGG